jgi:hypothetical protein
MILLTEIQGKHVADFGPALQVWIVAIAASSAVAPLRWLVSCPSWSFVDEGRSLLEMVRR